MLRGRACRLMSDRCAPRPTRIVFWRWTRQLIWSWILSDQRGKEVFDVTFRPPISAETIEANPIPRPVPTEELICDTSKPYASDSACYPLDHTSEPSWSLSEVFGRKIRGACPLTESSGPASETVCIKVPSEREVFASTGAVERRYDNGLERCFKLPGMSLVISPLTYSI